MQKIAQYCQKCRAANAIGEANCQKCGTRLMLVTIPSAIRFEESEPTSFYEDYLLERVAILELRLAQLADRVAMSLDLILRQSNIIEKEHLLVETLVETVSILTGDDDEAIRQKWRDKVLSQKNKDEADDYLKKVFREILANHQNQQNKETFVRFLTEGLKQINRQEEKQGLKMLEQALIHSPENFQLLKFLAINFWRLEKIETARLYAEKANQVSSQNPQIWFLLMIILADLKENERAGQFLRGLLKQPKMEFCLYYVWGMLAADEENRIDALTAFKECLKYVENAETHYLVGCSYFQLERFKIAVRHFQQAIAFDENYPEAGLMLAITQELSGKKEEAEQLFEKMSNLPDEKTKRFLRLRKENGFKTVVPQPFKDLLKRKYRLTQIDSVRLQKLFREEVLKVLNES